jgi:hypothetical protein
MEVLQDLNFAFQTLTKKEKKEVELKVSVKEWPLLDDIESHLGNELQHPATQRMPRSATKT